MHLLRNLRLVAPLAIVNTTGYLLLNDHPFLPRQALPLTALDQAIPFALWTVWPYLLLLLAGPAVALFIRDRVLFERMLVAYGIAIGLNFLVWALLPTMMVRPPIPGGDSLTEAAYRLLVTVDAEGNCFPSGHVTIPAVACWALAQQHPRWRGAIVTLLFLFSLSILTTKQHYAVDLLGGLATAAAGVLVSGVLAALPKARVGAS